MQARYLVKNRNRLTEPASAKEEMPMAIYEIDVASACAPVTATDRIKIHLGGPDGGIVLDATHEAAHQLFDLLRTQLEAQPVSRLLHNAVVATRMHESA